MVRDRGRAGGTCGANEREKLIHQLEGKIDDMLTHNN